MPKKKATPPRTNSKPPVATKADVSELRAAINKVKVLNESVPIDRTPFKAGFVFWEAWWHHANLLCDALEGDRKAQATLAHTKPGWGKAFLRRQIRALAAALTHFHPVSGPALRADRWVTFGARLGLRPERMPRLEDVSKAEWAAAVRKWKPVPKDALDKAISLRADEAPEAVPTEREVEVMSRKRLSVAVFRKFWASAKGDSVRDAMRDMGHPAQTPEPSGKTVRNPRTS